MVVFVSCTSALPGARSAAAAPYAFAARDSIEGTAAPPLQLRPHMNGWGAWLGGSFHASTLIAQTEEARFGIVGLQFGRVLAIEDDVAVRFSTDLIPAAVLSYPEQLPASDGSDSSARALPAKTAYGVGFVPVGLQFVYHIDGAVQPFFGGSGGFMYFPSPVPDERGRKLNYTFDVSIGMRWILDAGRVLTVGYRFHHLSNGFRGEINPGFDANILFVGLSTM